MNWNKNRNINIRKIRGRIRKSGWEPNRNINIREDKGGELGRVDGNLIGKIDIRKIMGEN